MENLNRPELIADEACERQVELMRDRLALQTYVGYPNLSERLVVSYYPGYPGNESGLTLPDGPWTVNAHPNRPGDEAEPSAAEAAFLANNLGLTLDGIGRPLHPWLAEMITDPKVGVVTGRGFYRSWGPNYTADSLYYLDGQVLLTRRNDTGNWALPGGFIDPGETDAEAGPREVREEAGIELAGPIDGEIFYSGIILDLRTTAHAWAETTARLYRLDHSQIVGSPVGSNETIESKWVNLDEAINHYVNFGAHKFLLEQAARRLT